MGRLGKGACDRSFPSDVESQVAKGKAFMQGSNRLSKGSLLSLLVIALSTVGAEATVIASGDVGNPVTTTSYDGTGGSGFAVTEDVAADPLAGPWHKELVNVASGIGSGSRVDLVETLTNVGTGTWTEWSESIFSTTEIGGDTYAGFLFDKSSLILSADRGTGIVALTEGVDYTLVTIDFSGPFGGGDNDGWEAITIFFEPGAGIAPGETLVIDSQIFEVFLDADPWRPDEAAVIRQYPTSVPEPATAMLLALGLAAYALNGRMRLGERG